MSFAELVLLAFARMCFPHPLHVTSVHVLHVFLGRGAVGLELKMPSLKGIRTPALLLF